MASPQCVASKVRYLSSQTLRIPSISQYLSLTPKKENSTHTNEKDHLSFLNVDTPNRKKILQDGLPDSHYAILGSGSFGTVYKANYKGAEVAAKIIHKRKCNENFSSEKQASSLMHSNIVQVLRVEEGNTLSLIMMELCDTTLQDRLEQRCLNAVERVCILKAIICAVQFCHQCGIVHADIKPKNILFAANGQPKLTDFGSSVVGSRPKAPLKFYGTPGYTAPEVLKGNIPNSASDIYSLGIIAWQMLSRKVPFAGLHAHTIIYMSATGARPFDEYLYDEFYGNYKSLYRKMWLQDVTNRPTLTKVMDELELLYS